MNPTAAKVHRPSYLFATGASVFTDDVPTPAETLVVVLGTSAIARGKIISMDLDSVRNAPGVVDVLTAVEIPGVNHSSLLGTAVPLAWVY